MRVGAGQRALVGEDERAVLVGRGVGEVVRRAGAMRPAPRVGAQQLGVHVDLDRHRLRRVGWRCPARARRAPRGGRPGRSRSGAAQAGGRRQVVARVAAPAGELRRRPDPLVLDAEPDAVGELERRRPDPAHLAGDVPAVGVEAAVLEADRVRPRARGHLAPVLQPLTHAQLRRRSRGRRHQQHGGAQRRRRLPPHVFLPCSPPAVGLYPPTPWSPPPRYGRPRRPAP